MPRLAPSLLALLLLAAPGLAAAQTSLDGVGRISTQLGWRVTTNHTFTDGYYAQPANVSLERAEGSPGGPLVAATFGYAVSEHVELGVDLFATGERIHLTGAPTLTTLTYGAMVGLRLQTLFEGVGPQGLIPWVGILTGPTLVLSTFEGSSGTEGVRQAWGLTTGASLRLTPRWAATAELRGVLVRGPVKDLGSVNGGGAWMALGLTYSFDPEPSRPVNW